LPHSNTADYVGWHPVSKPSKYKNVKKTVDNVEFHSIKEADRYITLRTLLRAKQIFDLELQPEFPFHIDGKKIFVYIADFIYRDISGETIIEDVKGLKTPLYRLKRKLTEAQHKIRITET
jgi:hypothetical protein